MGESWEGEARGEECSDKARTSVEEQFLRKGDKSLKEMGARKEIRHKGLLLLLPANQPRRFFLARGSWVRIVSNFNLHLLQ